MTSVLMVMTSHEELGDTGQTTGWYLSEAAHPWKVFTEAGFDLLFTSPSGGRPAMDGADDDDEITAEFLDTFGPDGPDTVTPDTIDASQFDVVFFVGGHGAMWDLPGDERLAGIAADVFDAGGVVSAVCHGPAGLVDVVLGDGTHLVAGRDVAAFTNSEEKASDTFEVVPFLLEDRLRERGATHHSAPDFEEKVVTDGRLVTGQNPASATGVAEAVVAVVGETSGDTSDG